MSRVRFLLQVYGLQACPELVSGSTVYSRFPLFRPLPLQGLDELFGPFRVDEPGAGVAALDPDELVGAGDVHLHDAASFSPEPAEPAPQASGPDAHAPADFAAHLLLPDEADVADGLAPYLPALERPDNLDEAGVQDEPAGPEPDPDPEVDGCHKQARGDDRPGPECGAGQEHEGQGQHDEGEDPDLWGHRGQPEARLFSVHQDVVNSLFSISFCIEVFIIRLWEGNVKVGEGLILSPAQGRVPYFRVFAQSKRPIADSAFQGRVLFLNVFAKSQ